MTKRACSAHSFRLALSLALPLLLALALPLLLGACGKGGDESQDSKPVPVSTMVLQAKTVPLVAEFTGRTDAESTVELQARISGFLKKINFVEGSLVKAGDLLFIIDPVE